MSETVDRDARAQLDPKQLKAREWSAILAMFAALLSAALTYAAMEHRTLAAVLIAPALTLTSFLSIGLLHDPIRKNVAGSSK